MSDTGLMRQDRTHVRLGLLFFCACALACAEATGGPSDDALADTNIGDSDGGEKTIDGPPPDLGVDANPCEKDTPDGTLTLCIGCCDSKDDEDECDDDVLTCDGCIDAEGSTVEICDDKDNDCDGEVDDSCMLVGPWTFETVDALSLAGISSQIRVDSNRDVHITYHQDTTMPGGLPTGNTKYATRASGEDAWTIETIDTLAGATFEWGYANGGNASSLALDASGNLRLSYVAADWDLLGIVLKYATRESGSWVNSVVELTQVCCYQSSLFVDDSGGLHVSYMRSSGDMHLAYGYSATGETWTTEDVLVELFSGWESSLAVDPSGAIHIAYRDGDSTAVTYVTRAAPEDDFAFETIDDTGGYVGSFAYPHLALDSAGNVHVAYHAAMDGTLRYAVGAPGEAFVTETVDASEPYAGRYVSMTLDAAETTHIVYVASLLPAFLKYARRPVDGEWEIEIADLASDYPAMTAIDVDSTQRVHVTYYEALTGDLLYGYRSK